MAGKKKKRCKRLTKEQKKVVWSAPESNAGVGWTSPFGHPVSDPVEYEYGGKEEDDR